MTKEDDLESRKLELAVHLEEFKAMRAEILEHLKFQTNALTYGTSILAATAGALAALYARTDRADLQAIILFSVAGLPVVTFLVAMWMVHKESMLAQIGLYPPETTPQT